MNVVEEALRKRNEEWIKLLDTTILLVCPKSLKAWFIKEANKHPFTSLQNNSSEANV